MLKFSRSARALVRFALKGSILPDGGAPASRLAGAIELRLLRLLAEQNAASLYATISVVIMAMLVAPFLAHTGAIVGIVVARALAMVVVHECANRLIQNLDQGAPSAGLTRFLVTANGISAFLWGVLTWPLEIGMSLDFMSFLIITISLFSVCLSVVSAGLHGPTLRATAFGGLLGLAAMIAWLTPQIGILLPIGFAVFGATIIAYALVISRQAHIGVLTQIRAERISARLAKSNTALQNALNRANWLASRDDLTTLRNRRAFESALPDLIEKFTHRRICLLLLDIDHFKHINDQFGHDTGDGVLVAIGTALRQWEEGGSGRLTGRWGGEEFITAIALRGDEKPALVAEDLRLRIQALGEQLHWPSHVRLTTSIGCATLDGPSDFDAALFRADGALYSAKDSGRNCWMMAA